MDLSFSGLLTASIRKYKSGEALEDVCYSLQETAFSMLIEVTERAIAHTQKKEVMLCGGVAANMRLREMVSVMSDEHYTEFYMPPIKYCGDNGAMIAWMGQLMFKNELVKGHEDTNVIQKFRTDQVDVPWMKSSNEHIELPEELKNKGAEANIYPSKWMNEEVIIKKRIPKSYRIPEIDSYLRKKRTNSEAKLLANAKACGVKTPLIYDIDKSENAIYLENIRGTVVKDLFKESETIDPSKLRYVCEEIGKNISKLHNCNIIHGDLTSSNMILQDHKLFFIDFGLGRVSNLTEDKGVDLLVFKKAISGIHHSISDKCFEFMLMGYQDTNDYDAIIKKVREIEKRGRYTSK